MKISKVHLREKNISKGRKSLYLDFYPAIPHPDTGKLTRREFLGLYVYARPRTGIEKEHNKQTRLLGERIRATRQLEIQSGVLGEVSLVKRNTDFLDYFRMLTDKKYSSEGNYGNWKSVLRQLEACWPEGLKFKDMTQAKAIEFREFLVDSPKFSQNTKASYYAKFRAALKQAYQENYLKEEINKKVKAIKQEETMREFVTMEELKLLRDTECQKPALKQAFIFSALSGLRYSDIYALTWQQVRGNEENGYFLHFTQQKTKGAEVHPIPNPARQLMGEAGDPEAKVFPKLKSKLNVWDNLRLKQWVLAAGINKDLTFHCARHSYATILLTLGEKLYTISKMLGHKELRTTQIYGKIVDKKKEEAAKRLNDFEL